MTPQKETKGGKSYFHNSQGYPSQEDEEAFEGLEEDMRNERSGKPCSSDGKSESSTK